MKSSTQKLIVAGVLFSAWVGLTITKVFLPALDTSLLIPTIQSALTGLGVYHTMKPDTQPEITTEKAPTP